MEALVMGGRLELEVANGVNQAYLKGAANLRNQGKRDSKRRRGTDGVS